MIRTLLTPAAALLLVAASLTWLMQSQWTDFSHHPDHTIAPGCDIPITLHLEQPDGRFGLEEATIRHTLIEAIDLWEGASDTQLFVLTENEGMPVRFVYGERQATGADQARERAQLDERRRALEQDRARFEGRREELSREIDEFEREQRALNRRIERHQQAVTDYNEGRGPRDAARRDQLVAKQQALEEQQTALDTRRSALERRQENLNAQGQQLNQAFDSLSAELDSYNEAASAQGGFELGRFTLEGGERRIEIFQALDQDQLRLILAHELGHALGIDHVPQEDAIMSSHLTQSNAGRTGLSRADRTALMAACDIGPAPQP